MENLHRIYFSFIHDAGNGGADDAERLLGKAKDTYLNGLYDAGAAIGRVVRNDADPSTLDSAVEKMKDLPLLDYWKGFIEISAQVVIGKALSVTEGKTRSGLLVQGLKMMSVATFGAFPLSGYSSEMVKKAKAAEPSLAETADAILMNNKGLEPWSPSRRRSVSMPAPAQREKKIRS